MLTINNLYKSFGDKEVLHGINFAVKEGHIVGLLGPNGAGKTTTMRIITGFLSPSKGTVIVNGNDITHLPLEKKALFGYLPENNPLYDFLTPYEYLEFVNGMKKNTRETEKEEVEKIMKVCGLVEVAREKIDILSRGYKQRTGLAGALIGNPSILILDEPTVGLDPNQREEIKKLIKKLKKTTLFSSHILSEINDICQEAVIIHKGRVIAQGKISKLTQKEGASLEITIKIGLKETKKEATEKLKIQLAKSKEKDFSFLPSAAQTIKLTVAHPQNPNLVREIIWKLCQKNNWQLHELKETSESLDQVFQKLTKEQ